MRHVKQVLASLSVVLPVLVWGVAQAGAPVAAAAHGTEAARPFIAAASLMQDQYSSMPEAPGKAVTVATCTKCHSITNVTAQHKDMDGWTSTITKMVGYGAVGSDDDFQAILTYLAKYYGPDAPPVAPGPPPATPPGK